MTSQNPTDPPPIDAPTQSWPSTPPPTEQPPTSSPPLTNLPPTSPPPPSPPPTTASQPSPPPAAPDWRPPSADNGRNASLVFGVILLIIGGWFFATQTLGLDLPDLDWGQLWPLILIVIGVWIVLGAMRRRR